MGRRWLMLAIPALALAACSPSENEPTRSPSAPPSQVEASADPDSTLSPRPTSDTKADGDFTITVTVPASRVTTATAITPVASFGYVGPLDSAVVFHGSPLVYWSINEVDGRRAMNGGVDTICIETTLAKGTGFSQDFMKSGEISEDPATGFELAWFRQPLLRLPAGRWDITATLDLTLDECGGERHQIAANVEVEVSR